MTDEQLLEWAKAQIQKAQKCGMYGSICFKLEAGKITRLNVEKSVKPTSVDLVP